MASDDVVAQIRELAAASSPLGHAQAVKLLHGLPWREIVQGSNKVLLLPVLQKLCTMHVDDDENRLPWLMGADALEKLSAVLQRALCGRCRGSRGSSDSKQAHPLPFDAEAMHNETWLAWSELEPILFKSRNNTGTEGILAAFKSGEVISDAERWEASVALREGAGSMLVGLVAAATSLLNSHESSPSSPTSLGSGSSGNTSVSSSTAQLTRCRLNCSRAVWALCVGTRATREEFLTHFIINDGGLQVPTVHRHHHHHPPLA